MQNHFKNRFQYKSPLIATVVGTVTNIIYNGNKVIYFTLGGFVKFYNSIYIYNINK